jgi:transcriptional regulator with XRE-family HTH domain
MINKEIGNRLKSYRKKNNLSQTDFSKILGLTRSTYAGHERGELNFNAQLIIHICDVTGLKLNYLFYGLSYKEPSDKDLIDKRMALIEKEIGKIRLSFDVITRNIIK